jgi:DNA-binding PadR family transcriptional regulator
VVASVVVGAAAVVVVTVAPVQAVPISARSATPIDVRCICARQPSSPTQLSVAAAIVLAESSTTLPDANVRGTGGRRRPAHARCRDVACVCVSFRYSYIETIHHRTLGVSVLDFAILGLLQDEPRHGYELKRALGDLGFWQVSFGSLYPALRRLDKQGLIEATAGQGRRKAYRLTPAGSTRLQELLADPNVGNDSDRAFQLRLAFLASLEPRLRLGVLEERRHALQDRLHGARRSFKGARSGRGTDRYRLALMERSVKSTEADIAWLDELIAGERSAAAGA